MISSPDRPLRLHLEDVVERGERAGARVAGVLLAQLLRDDSDLVLVEEVERGVELLEVDDARLACGGASSRTCCCTCAADVAVFAAHRSHRLRHDLVRRSPRRTGTRCG